MTDLGVPVRVKRSKIHGRGVFAAADVAPGTPVLEYTGERISRAEARRRYGAEDPTFLLALDERTVIDGSAAENAARFVNHACEPSCELLVYKKRVFLIANRKIRKGEELTYDYALVLRGDVDPLTAIAVSTCTCGSARCRGTMLRDDDEAEPAPKPKRSAKKAAKVTRSSPSTAAPRPRSTPARRTRAR